MPYLAQLKTAAYVSFEDFFPISKTILLSKQETSKD